MGDDLQHYMDRCSELRVDRDTLLKDREVFRQGELEAEAQRDSLRAERDELQAAKDALWKDWETAQESLNEQIAEADRLRSELADAAKYADYERGVAEQAEAEVERLREALRRLATFQAAPPEDYQRLVREIANAALTDREAQ